MEGIRLETALKDIDGFVVVEVSGEVDVYTATALREALNEVVDNGQNHVIVNMEHVKYMDSSGFGTLLSVMKRVRPDGGSVNLVSCNNAIDRMLKITRLNTVFRMHGSLDEAISNLKEQLSSE